MDICIADLVLAKYWQKSLVSFVVQYVDIENSRSVRISMVVVYRLTDHGCLQLQACDGMSWKDVQICAGIQQPQDQVHCSLFGMIFFLYLHR